MLLMLEVGWRGLAVRGEEAACFRKVVCVSIVAAGGPHSATHTLTVDSRVAYFLIVVL